MKVKRENEKWPARLNNVTVEFLARVHTVGEGGSMKACFRARVPRKKSAKASVRVKILTV